MRLKSKDLLGMKELTEPEILLILEKADEMKRVVLSKNKKAPLLSGSSILTMFYENSTRTRLSFELASKFLGATAANFSSSGSSVAKGETLIDTGKTLEAMGTDIVIVRHQNSGAPHFLARNINASVINAGDGMNEHPTQALLDFFTMKEKYKSFKGLNVAIVGDILHSRVARSNIWGLKKLGANVTVCGPLTMMPPEFNSIAKNTNYIKEAVKNADVVMALRIQLERQKGGLIPSAAEYFNMFAVTDESLTYAKKEALVMHPGPVNRGVEISSAVVDGEQSVINEQVTNGVAVRMAILNLLWGAKQSVC